MDPRFVPRKVQPPPPSTPPPDLPPGASAPGSQNQSQTPASPLGTPGSRPPIGGQRMFPPQMAAPSALKNNPLFARLNKNVPPSEDNDSSLPGPPPSSALPFSNSSNNNTMAPPPEIPPPPSVENLKISPENSPSPPTRHLNRSTNNSTTSGIVNSRTNSPPLHNDDREVNGNLNGQGQTHSPPKPSMTPASPSSNTITTQSGFILRPNHPPPAVPNRPPPQGSPASLPPSSPVPSYNNPPPSSPAPSIPSLQHQSSIPSKTSNNDSEDSGDEDDDFTPAPPTPSISSSYHSNNSHSSQPSISLSSPTQSSFSVASRSAVLLYEGLLKKKSPSGLKLWQDRYFKLFSDRLQYFKRRGDSEEQGNVPLYAIRTVDRNDKEKGRFDISLSGGGSGGAERTFKLKAASMGECDIWLAKIEGALKSSKAANSQDKAAMADAKFWKNKEKSRQSLVDTSSIGSSSLVSTSLDEDNSISPSLISNSLSNSQSSISLAPSLSSSLGAQSLKPNTNAHELPIAVSILTRLSLSNFSTHSTNDPSSVYLVHDLAAPTRFYILHSSPLSDNDSFDARAKTLSPLYCPYLMRQLFRGRSTDAVWAVYTPAFKPDNSLSSHLHQVRGSRFPDHVVRLWAAQLTCALSILHEANLTSKGLSTDNIFIDGDGNAVLFDLAIGGSNNYGSSSNSSVIPCPDSNDGAISDWWRLGTILYQLVVGVPVQSNSITATTALSDNIKFPPYVSTTLSEFIRGLLETNPRKRIGSGRDWKDVRGHPFFLSRSGEDIVAWDKLAAGLVDDGLHSRSVNWIRHECLCLKSGPSVPPSSNGMTGGYTRDLAFYWTCLAPCHSVTLASMASRVTVSLHVITARDIPLIQHCEMTVSGKNTSANTGSSTIIAPVFLVVSCSNDDRLGAMVTSTSSNAVTQFDQTFTFQLQIDSSLQDAHIVTQIRIDKHHSKQQPNALTGVCGASVDVNIGSLVALLGEIEGNSTTISHSAIDPSSSVPVCEVTIKYAFLRQSVNIVPIHQSGQAPFITLSTPFTRTFGEESGEDGGDVARLKEGHSVGFVAGGGTNASPADDDDDDDEEDEDGKVGHGVFFDPIRGLVSKKKVRFQQDGFDLDLAYVHENIIAMGFPSEGLEKAYRNPLVEVQQFFQKYHPGSYRIYNLCSERHYAASKFDNNVCELPFDDHNAPPFSTLIDFCMDAWNWINKKPNNVIAVHCKAGKGRTGTAIACYLQYAGLASSATEALSIFGSRRTKDGKGVTIPSQIRYIKYFEEYLASLPRFTPGMTLPPLTLVPVRLTKIKLSPVPQFDAEGGCDPYFRVKDIHGKVIYDSKKASGGRVKGYHSSSITSCELDIEGLGGALQLNGDVKFEFFDWDRFSGDDKMFHFWINSTFCKDSKTITLNKVDCDKAIKDKKCHHFAKDFKAEISFA